MRLARTTWYNFNVEAWERDLNACWQGRLQRLKVFAEQNNDAAAEA